MLSARSQIAPHPTSIPDLSLSLLEKNEESHFAENSVIAKETIINWLESYFQFCLYFVSVYN